MQALKDEAAEVQRWREHYLPLAESGDPSAQLNVATAYARGKFLAKDMGLAEQWYRRAERGLGERALFEWMKILSEENDPKMHSLFNERRWELGAIYWLYGRHYMLHGDRRRARELYKIGMRKGSCMAEAAYVNSTLPGAWKYVFFPIILLTAIRATFFRNKFPESNRLLR